MKAFEFLQAVLATLAFICATITTGAAIYRHDPIVGIIAYAGINAIIGVLLYMSIQELRAKEEGGDQ